MLSALTNDVLMELQRRPTNAASRVGARRWSGPHLILVGRNPIDAVTLYDVYIGRHAHKKLLMETGRA